MNVRVRYAPSPTGLQHIGGVRTAVFDYLFARSTGGRFVLRIEDTDQARTTEESIQDLYDTLSWLGLQWDEGPEKGGSFGPYVQSERAAIYRDYTEQLIAAGHAYYCYCTPERLTNMRAEQEAKTKGTGYDRRCRSLDEGERKQLSAELAERGMEPVVRFKVPLEGTTVVNDLLLGEIKRKNRDINPDPIIMKSDGFPTYHLAVVIDDHLMEISHVLRAQEWIPSAPLHVLIHAAFGWDVPAYCHLPMVLGKDGKKLGKRHGSTSVREFRNKGYLPEAMLNYIALLGWSFDDSREFFTKDELERLFSLDKLNKAPAVFDYKKLDWFNGQYIRQMDDDRLNRLIVPYLQRDGIVSDPVSSEESAVVGRMIPLVKERLRILSEVSDLVRFLFQDVDGYGAEDLIPKKADAEKTREILKRTRDILNGFWDRSEEENEQLFREAADQLEVKLGAMLMPVRVAVTGSTSSPPLFGSLELLGRDTTLERIDSAIDLLEDVRK